MVGPLRALLIGALAGLACLLVACSAGTPRGPAIESGVDQQRGALLYDTACVACHTQQAHWRDKRLVHSWPDLLYQVERWQKVAGQGWSAEDVKDVAAFLNERFYYMPCPEPGCQGPRAEAGGY